MTRRELAAILEARRADLGSRSIDRLYREDPIWESRFGARGRKFAHEDGQFHVTYLVEALRADSADSFDRYAVWLRSVLVPRGMCSQQLADNFAALAALIDAELADAGAALQILAAGARALDWTEGPAQPLAAQRDRIVDETARALQAAGDGSLERQLRHHLSYLGDALALARPDLFVAYARWLAGYHAAHGDPRRLDETLRALAAAVGRVAPAGAALLAEAQATVRA